MQKSETIAELTKALCQVQSQLKPAKKDAENPYFKSRYANLTSVWESCRELLAKNGLAVIQTSSVSSAGELILDTTLAHASGEWISGSLTVPLIKNDPQSLGSAMTYARRYGLSAIVGICADDDDGNESSPKKTEHSQEPKTESKPTYTDLLKEYCATLQWGQDEWRNYVKEQFGKEKLSQLTQDEKNTALANLKAMAMAKKEGLQPDLVK